MKKQFSKKTTDCKVTFQLPVEAVNGAKEVFVVGDFNEWVPAKSYQLKAKKDGTFATTVSLPVGKDYHFRYCIDGEKWENDWNADRYEVSPLHGHVENSVLSLPKVDNLTKIEGIGPKIAGLLNEAGIETFEALSKAPKATLTGVLEAAGKRFRMHDPSTWAKQAKLAADGNWDKLNKWQDELKGGKLN